MVLAKMAFGRQLTQVHSCKRRGLMAQTFLCCLPGSSHEQANLKNYMNQALFNIYNNIVNIDMLVHLIANKNALQNALSLELLHSSTFMSSETRYRSMSRLTCILLMNCRSLTALVTNG